MDENVTWKLTCCNVRWSSILINNNINQIDCFSKFLFYSKNKAIVHFTICPMTKGYDHENSKIIFSHHPSSLVETCLEYQEGSRFHVHNPVVTSLLNILGFFTSKYLGIHMVN